MSAKKLILSGSTDNKLIKVTGTTTGASVTVHTTHATLKEEIWLWAYNGHTADVKLTVEWDGATVPDNLIERTIPFKSGLKLVIPGLAMSGTGTVKLWAATADVIYVTGFANQLGGVSNTLTKEFFSGGADGGLVKPTATASPGTTIHTSHSTAYDEIWGWAMNYNAASEEITIEWGGTGADDKILQTISGENGLVQVIPGIPLTNSGTFKVFSNPVAVNMGGYVNRWA